MAVQAKSKKKISVVFVCTANVCRSPVAEYLFKAELKKARKASKFRVFSAGVSAYDGFPMSRLSAIVLKEAHIPFGAHKSRYLSDKMIQSTDFIICMTEGHKRALFGPPNAYALGEITGGGDCADPYGGTRDDYQRMFDQLHDAMPEILAFIERNIV